MTWALVSDSTCEIRSIDHLAPHTAFYTVPLKIRMGEREYVDNAMLDTKAMLDAMANYNGPSSTACPAPEEWAEKFLLADQVFAITITSSLSGSYNSAMVARDMVLESHPEKKIYVMDSLSCGGELALILWHVNELIREGVPFEEVCAEAERYCSERTLLFALANFDNLVKNGRMNRLVGFMAGKLNMRAVGIASDEGKIAMVHKTRGEIKMLAFMMEEMDRRGFTGGPVVISHCNNSEGAHRLSAGIRAKWPDSKVTVLPCGGLTSFYAEEQGILLGF